MAWLNRSRSALSCEGKRPALEMKIDLSFSCEMSAGPFSTNLPGTAHSSGGRSDMDVGMDVGMSMDMDMGMHLAPPTREYRRDAGMRAANCYRPDCSA